MKPLTPTLRAIEGFRGHEGSLVLDRGLVFCCSMALDKDAGRGPGNTDQLGI